MKKSECRKLKCHWFDGIACHLVSESYSGVEPEYVESGCVPETYNEYVERNREISIPEKASCKNCKHCIYCNKVDYPGIKSSFHYCDIFTYGKNDIALKLYQSRQLCRFSRYESK